MKLLLPLLALAAPTTVPVAAQEPPDDPAPTERRSEDEARDMKRVLRLADGTFVRARSRLVEGRWEVRVGPEWFPLEGDVVAAKSERELLAEGSRMEGELDRTNHVGRVALARWYASNGLYSEALEVLDRVFAIERRNELALTAAREIDVPADVLLEAFPEDLMQEVKLIFKRGARAKPARREALAWHLASLSDRIDVRDVVQVELMRPQFRRREFAAYCSHRLFPGELRKELTDRAILDTMGNVREQAVAGLRATEDVRVIAPFIDALGSRMANVRHNAAEGLGDLGMAAGVEPLVAHLAHMAAGGTGTSGVRANMFVGFQTAYVQDYDVEIAQGASIADPVLAVQQSGVVFDVRAQAQITKQIEYRAVMGSLRQLTGQKFRDPADWMDWWAEHKDAWRSKELSRLPDSESGR